MGNRFIIIYYIDEFLEPNFYGTSGREFEREDIVTVSGRILRNILTGGYVYTLVCFS